MLVDIASSSSCVSILLVVTMKECSFLFPIEESDIKLLFDEGSNPRSIAQCKMCGGGACCRYDIVLLDSFYFI
jgi:hypothetical protein